MGGIPGFPEYARVDHDIKDAFAAQTARYLPYSDFTFVNIVSWDAAETAQTTMLHDNLVVRMSDYVDGAVFYSFLGDNRVDETVDVLLDEAEKHTGTRQLRLVPEIGARALMQPNGYAIEEDPDEHDYVISLPAIVDRWGARFRHMRREVNFFSTNYERHSDFQELDIRNPAVQTEITSVFLEREASKLVQQHGNNYDNELVALGRLFDYVDPVALRTFGLAIQGVLKAFIVCETLDEEWCVGHFWKADTNYRGIYRYLMTRVAERLTADGLVSMNIEQDLGIEGLKRMKSFLNPVDRLKKYTITDRDLRT